MLKFSWRKSFSVIPSSFISHSSHNLSPLSFRCPSPCSSLLYHNPSFLLLLWRSHLQWLSAHHVVSCCLVHLAIPRRIPLSLARPPIRLVHRCAQSLAWCLNDSFNDWSPLHQGSCCTSLHQYNYSFSMIFVIYSRVKDGFSFCQLHPCHAQCVALIPMMSMFLPVIYFATCAMLPLLYSVRTLQFPISMMFLGCTSGLHSSVGFGSRAS